jgi:uncharacterized repeat protein (TIGR04042 family)
MPEVQLSIEWPDGRTTPFYSPSTVILNYLRPGEQLPVQDLTEKVREGLRQASERVRARYGFACTRADEEERKLLETADAYDREALVRIRES